MEAQANAQSALPGTAASADDGDIAEDSQLQLALQAVLTPSPLGGAQGKAMEHVAVGI